jgi:hypothetical protein
MDPVFLFLFILLGVSIFKILVLEMVLAKYVRNDTPDVG